MKYLKTNEFFKRSKNKEIETEAKVAFTEDEIIELGKLGFVLVDGKFEYSDNVNTLSVYKDSVSHRGVTEEWYGLHIKYDKMFNHMKNSPKHFQKFDMSILNSKHETYDTFEELVDNVKIYMK